MTNTALLDTTLYCDKCELCAIQMILTEPLSFNYIDTDILRTYYRKYEPQFLR